MRTLILPFCSLSAEDLSVAAARMKMPASVCDGFGDFRRDIEANGKPGLIVMDFSWVQMLPYDQYNEASLGELAAVPHLMIHAGNDHGMAQYGRGEELNVIGVLPPEDTHAPLFDRTKRNRLMMALDAFETMAATMPVETITAQAFAPMIQTIKRTPAAKRARMCYAIAA